MSRNRQTPPRHHRANRIRINGRLYEAVSPRSRSHRSAKRLNESYEDIYKTLTPRQWESLKQYIIDSRADVTSATIEEDYNSAVHFLDSVNMKISWENDNGWIFKCDVEVDDEWWFGYGYGGVSGEVPDGDSDGVYVGEGLLDIWKKNRSKLKKLMKAAYDAVPDYYDYTDYDSISEEDEDKYDDIVEKLAKELEKVAKKLAEEISNDITDDYEYHESDEYIKELIDDGIVDDEISEWLDQEDIEYTSNESYRPMKRRSGRYRR